MGQESNHPYYFLRVVVSRALPEPVFGPDFPDLSSGELGARPLEHLRVGSNPLVGDPLVADHHRATTVPGQVIVATGLKREMEVSDLLL